MLAILWLTNRTVIATSTSWQSAALGKHLKESKRAGWGEEGSPQ